MPARIPIPREEIEDFCRSHNIVRLSLFGSVLREDFGRDSDVDILVEFAPGATVTLFGLVAMELALSRILGRQVDLNTPKGLSKYFRDAVLADAEVLYVAA